MKILISAYACEPHKGSEQGVAWNLVREISHFHEVWVITRANNRSVITEEMDKSPNRNLHFSYVDLPRWASPWKRGGRGLYFYYFLWQVAAYLRARVLHHSQGFDLAHHLTFGAVWLPCFLPLLPIPFIFGPVGGFEVVPIPFRAKFSLAWRLYEGLRDVLLWCTLHINPLSKYSCQKASIILVRTRATYDALAPYYREKLYTMLETGVHASDLKTDLAIEPKKACTFRIIMVGRLIALKGFTLGIYAFKKMLGTIPEAQMFIIGSGPDLQQLKTLCTLLNLDGKVFFLGQLPHEKVLEHLGNSDVFLHPSLKEAGAWVVFEAMSSALPIVCFDYSGPGEIVTHECGIKIKVTNPEQAIIDIADALRKLAIDRDLREKLSRGAIERLQSFLWEDKVKVIDKLYSKFIKK